MLRLGWMSTARGQGSLALLRVVCDSINEGTLDACIPVVVSNRVPGEAEQTDRFFEYCRQQGLPLVCESSQCFRQTFDGADWRTSFDRLLASHISQYEVDVFLLAGYMLIVSEFLCSRYPLLNLHPALPNGPKGTWREVMSELARTDATETGAMIHVVTPDLDRGPVVSYFSFPLDDEPFKTLRSAGDIDALADAIRAHELEREYPLILTTLHALSAGHIVLTGGRPYDASGTPLTGGLDLSVEVERMASGSAPQDKTRR